MNGLRARREMDMTTGPLTAAAMQPPANTHSPRVVIVGGGFGGLRAAQKLQGQPCQVTLIDRRNHHVFQPLLYQVATAGLSPADIASPIRSVLRKQANATVVMDEITEIDTAQRVARGANGEYPYDFLILAAGATHAYFGNEQWAEHAPGLKTVDDALEIRRRMLIAFEAAEQEADEAARRAKLTFVVVGGGPTGVEMAGALREIAVETIPKDFRRVDTSTARVMLVEGQGRLLAAMSETASARALADLQKLGVEVRLNAFVTDISDGCLNVGDERIAAETVVWAAGVKASPLGELLGAERDRAGRVKVNADCSVPGLNNVFVVGDMAHAIDSGTNAQVPGVAQGALQMGEHVAVQIIDRLSDPRKPATGAPFLYNDKGSMATIGRAKAVVDVGGRSFGGLIAWLLWCFVHVAFLVQFRNRVAVMSEWVWAYVWSVRGARLITGDVRTELHTSLDEAD